MTSAERLRATMDRARSGLTADHAGRIVVVGDVMLDRYVDGTSTRLSPEAPVPVVDVVDELDRLGGAANVAAGLAALGASVLLVGVVGDDQAGRRVQHLLDALPTVTAHLVVDPTRPTTTKERIRVAGRHLVRIDREDRTDVAPAVARELHAVTQQALGQADLLVVSDYAKGTVPPSFVASLDQRPCTVVDPKHPDVERYLGAEVLAPNRAEALAASGKATLEEAVADLTARLPGAAIVVTCGAGGVVWSTDGDTLGHLPSLASHVEDVTGAGDSVVCGLAAALATGATLEDAIVLASAVAASAVAAPGTASPTWSQVGDDQVM